MPDHDFIVGSCAFTYGTVYLDKNAYILHRRHGKSITSGGNGIVKRLKVEFNIVFNRHDIKYNMAKLLLRDIDVGMDEEIKEFLTLVSEYKNSINSWWKLVTYRKLTSKIFVCDLEQRLKMLMLNY